MSEHITKPPHYLIGDIETIDIIEAKGLLGGFCLGNIIKYACRALHKGQLQDDLKKIAWYSLYYFMRERGTKANDARANLVTIIDIVESGGQK